MNILFLSLSIILSAARNIFSKNMSDVRFGTKAFFQNQCILFFCGSAVLFLFGGFKAPSASPLALIYGLIYGILLIFAQWFYTVSLFGGNTSLCSTVYSPKFVFPTIFGSIFYFEGFSPFDFVGILCAISATIISGCNFESKNKDFKSTYFFPLITAMLASGGLGIVQKLQQNSSCASEKSVFLLSAFFTASAISFTSCLFAKKADTVPVAKKGAVAAAVGVFFGCCNFSNTYLAGKLPSAFFFPTLNIGVILLSALLGAVLYKEKTRKKKALCLPSVLCQYCFYLYFKRFAI